MTAPPQQDVLTVSEVTRQIKDCLEGNFYRVWVVGEITNCTRAGSGHIYLTLKDDRAQLRAVVWRSTAARLKFDLHDGLEVVASGPVELYEARGTYQLTIEQLVPQGLGALELAFRQLCEKLQAQGLFAPERKRPIPRFPRRIALVTSRSGAALRDMLQVIGRRWKATDVVILPVPVQGAGAAEEIAAALRSVPRIPGVEVVITGRGGGSLEDLWAFNEEIVARAIYESPMPVISAVGHEIDVTIADLVADCRALTPSEAGELVVPHRDEIRQELRRLQSRLVSALQNRAARARAQLDGLADRRVLTRPYDRLHDLSRRLDELEARGSRALRARLAHHQQSLAHYASALDALSPLKVLERGYSLTRTTNGTVVRNVAEVHPGQELETILVDGRVRSRVTAVTPSS